MPTETLHFENARVAQQLFNNDPQNLKAIESQLGVKATSREGWIRLEGPAEAVERTEGVEVIVEDGDLHRDTTEHAIIIAVTS